MAKKIATFFPRIKRAVKGFLTNANLRLAAPPAGDDMATKYSLDATKVARLVTLEADIPTALDKAEQYRDLAQQQTDIADAGIREASLIVHDFGDAIQKHSSYNPADGDLEALGFEQQHTPANPAEAKVKVTHITTLPDMIRFDWAKEEWNGIKIYYSADGINYSFLDKDDRSPFDDTRLNKIPNTPETRYYIFRHMDKDGKDIGQETKVQVVAAIYDIQGSRGVAN
jgi:hypothetical protein